MECVILAGGLGTRMRPVTADVPKALIPVAGRPFVDRQLTWLAKEGVERVVYSIGYRGEMLRKHIGDGRRFGLTVEYVDEGARLRGTGGALRLALDEDALPAHFLVLYGDSYLPVRVRPIWNAFCQGRDRALMTVLRNGGRWGPSNAVYSGGRVLLYDKSPGAPGAFEFVDYGLSALRRKTVEQIPPDVTFDLATLFHELSVAGHLAGFEVRQRFYEVGSPEGLADLEALLAGADG